MWNKLFFIIDYLIIILILDINLIKTEIIIKKIIIQSLSDKKVFQSIINIFFCNKWMFSISRGRILLKIIASGRLLKIPSLLIMNPDWLPQAPSKYNSDRRAIVPRLDCTSARLYLDEKCTSTGLPWKKHFWAKSVKFEKKIVKKQFFFLVFC